MLCRDEQLAGVVTMYGRTDRSICAGSTILPCFPVRATVVLQRRVSRRNGLRAYGRSGRSYFP